MSPEQLFGEEVDARTDVYALALVAFKCFTGTLPFVSDTPERSMIARVGAKPKTLAAARPDVAWPAALQDAFNGAMAMEPADRTTSALAFGDAVVAAVEAWTGESVLRGRTPLSSASIPALSASRVSGTSPAIAAPAPAPSGATEASPSRSSMRWVIPVGVLAAAGVGAFLFMQSPDRAGGLTATTTTPPAMTDSTRGSSGAAAAEPTPPPATPTRDAAPVASPDRAPATSPATGAGTDAAPPTPAPTRSRDMVEAANDASEARATLNTIRQELAADDADEAAARQAVPRLERLLARLASRTDSASAYIALISAHGLEGHPERACSPLRAARALATTAAQQEIVRRFLASDQLTCAP
jgi:serine/threonine-protein kinase